MRAIKRVLEITMAEDDETEEGIVAAVVVIVFFFTFAIFGAIIVFIINCVSYRRRKYGPETNR